MLSDVYKFETSKDEEDTLYVADVNWTATHSQQVECHLYSENWEQNVRNASHKNTLYTVVFNSKWQFKTTSTN